MPLHLAPTASFVQKSLNGAVDASQTTITLSSTTNLQAPGTILIDRVDSSGNALNASLREIVYFTGINGNDITGCTRGYDGTTAQTHGDGAVCETTISAAHWASLTTTVSAFADINGYIRPIPSPASISIMQIKTLLNTSGASLVGVYPSGASGSILTSNGSSLPVFSNPNTDGWIQYNAVTPASGTLDDPSFEITFAGVDLTSILSVGMRVKISQSTTKYFIITKLAFATNTTVTLYGGTDYDLVSTGTTAISAFYYSSAKAPYGFPLDPLKWSVESKDTTLRQQSTPVSGTWYNLGSVTISIPIGVWSVEYMVSLQVDDSTTGAYVVAATLSTANNSESDVDFTAQATVYLNTAGGFPVYRRKDLALTSKTSYFLNSKVGSANVDTLDNLNNLSPAIVRVVSGYL